MAYSLDMRQRALELLKEGKTKKEVSKMLGVGEKLGLVSPDAI